MLKQLLGSYLYLKEDGFNSSIKGQMQITLMTLCLFSPNLSAVDNIIPLNNLVITAMHVEHNNDEKKYIHPRIGLKNKRKSFPIFLRSHPDGVCALIAAAEKSKSFIDTYTFENGTLPKLRKLSKYNITKSYFNNYSVEFSEEHCNDSEANELNDADYYLVSKKGVIIDMYTRKTCGNLFPKSYKTITCKKR